MSATQTAAPSQPRSRAATTKACPNPARPIAIGAAAVRLVSGGRTTQNPRRPSRIAATPRASPGSIRGCTARAGCSRPERSEPLHRLGPFTAELEPCAPQVEDQQVGADEEDDEPWMISVRLLASSRWKIVGSRFRVDVRSGAHRRGAR